MGIYEDRQIHTKTGFRPIKSQDSRSGLHTNRTPYNNTYIFQYISKISNMIFWKLTIVFPNVTEL